MYVQLFSYYVLFSLLHTSEPTLTGWMWWTHEHDAADSRYTEELKFALAAVLIQGKTFQIHGLDWDDVCFHLMVSMF